LGLSQDGGRANFSKNLRASPFTVIPELTKTCAFKKAQPGVIWVLLFLRGKKTFNTLHLKVFK
jgi:hypothetical protein